MIYLTTQDQELLSEQLNRIARVLSAIQTLPEDLITQRWPNEPFAPEQQERGKLYLRYLQGLHEGIGLCIELITKWNSLQQD